MIYFVPVEIIDGAFVAAQLLELGNASHTYNFLEIFADPKRKRGTPIPVPRHVPITRVGYPVDEAILHGGEAPRWWTRRS